MARYAALYCRKIAPNPRPAWYYVADVAKGGGGSGALQPKYTETGEAGRQAPQAPSHRSVASHEDEAHRYYRLLYLLIAVLPA